jgi:very-short-patch-repair endonuclease
MFGGFRGLNRLKRYGSHKLAIEVDGSIHAQQQIYDQARTDQLQAFGYYVLRFTNKEVIIDLSNVLNRISETAKLLPPKSPNSGGI